MLKHRIVMAPMTRQRSEQPGNVPGDLQLEYYTQRATDGGLIIAGRNSRLPAWARWIRFPRFVD